MANITINEISQNYTYAIGTNSYATIAMPITASWGPCTTLDGIDISAINDEDVEDDINEAMDNVEWKLFSSTREGLESFVSTYRGAASNYKLAKDFSYQMAMTLMSAGYDVLVCRMCPGTYASGTVTLKANDLSVTYDIKAKYPGSFGNSLMIKIKENISKHYTNCVVYVVDASGTSTAAENLTFTTNEEYATDTIVYIEELTSDFIELTVEDEGTLYPTDLDLTASGVVKSAINSVTIEGGSDIPEDLNTAISTSTSSSDFLTLAKGYAKKRFSLADYDVTGDIQFLSAFDDVISAADSVSTMTASTIAYRELIYLYAMYAMDLLTDKLAYRHNRIISSGWDDQDYKFLTGYTVQHIDQVSPLHVKMLYCAYYSRCATAYLDIPRGLARSGVYNDSEVEAEQGYAQMVSRFAPLNTEYDVNGTLYNTHAGLFAPWGQYKFTSTSKQNIAPPSFLALMIQRAMILNQSIQYEWLLPSNRQHSLNIGTLDYKVPKKLLDDWQSLEGVGVNVITYIPDLGVTLWGNSTLYEVPPATYQALANLSTRLLVNAVEDIVWRCGVSITFRYNNNDAYSAFYAGVTPTLDTMVNVGAIEAYYVTMNADINGEDYVNANSVIGKIYLVVNGVINDITVDLVCLPPNADISNYE